MTDERSSAATPMDDEAAAQHRKKRIGQCQNFLMLHLFGKYDELMLLSTPDCELHLEGGADLSPFAGTCYGREAAKAKLVEMHTTFEHLEIRPTSFVVEGDQAVMRLKSLGRNRGGGDAKWVDMLVLLRFTGDLVSYCGTFADTAALAHMSDWPQPS